MSGDSTSIAAAHRLERCGKQPDESSGSATDEIDGLSVTLCIRSSAVYRI